MYAQARQRGILNEADGRFVSTVTGKQMSLDDAVDAELVRVQFDEVSVQPGSEPAYETTTYAIGFVVDQVSSFSVVVDKKPLYRRSLAIPKPSFISSHIHAYSHMIFIILASFLPIKNFIHHL